MKTQNQVIELPEHPASKSTVILSSGFYIDKSKVFRIVLLATDNPCQFQVMFESFDGRYFGDFKPYRASHLVDAVEFFEQLSAQHDLEPYPTNG